MIGVIRSCCLIFVLLASTSVARAEFRGKGSTVGRILSESVASAATGEDGANDAINDGASAQPEEEKPISRDALNALMKHPTEPVYDPLRPMSGKWIRCQTSSENPAIKSKQDRYSSTDRSHFSHTLLFASDSDCKMVVSQQRSLYECTTDKKTLLCKLTKREAKTGNGAWNAVKLSGDEPPIALKFPGAPTKSKKSKKVAKARDPRKLEVVIDGDAVVLDYETQASAGHKTND